VSLLAAILAYGLVAESACPSIQAQAVERLEAGAVHTLWHCNTFCTVLSSATSSAIAITRKLAGTMMAVTPLGTNRFRALNSLPAFFTVALKTFLTGSMFASWSSDAMLAVSAVIPHVTTTSIRGYTRSPTTTICIAQGRIAVFSHPTIETNDGARVVADVPVLVLYVVRQTFLVEENPGYA